MEIKGIVFNIQKFSIHDGPGVRTTVFLKGCPLRCKWCANPESHLLKPQILHHSKDCIHCEKCAASCPEGAVSLDGGGNIRVDFAKCRGCLTCVRACPGRALSCEGEEKTVDEIVEVCMQDVDFYEESGGGVTLSGGEALMQPEFARALLQELKARDVHTAMETTGFAPPEVFAGVTAHADLLLFDMKHWNGEKHREGTGVDNTMILENMSRAIAGGKEVLPRLPVIPGYNDSLEDAAGFVRRLREVGADRIQLLPFHQFGENKYALLGRTYEYESVPALHKEELERFRQVFLDAGVDAFF
ncbi:glycyl-radical enzyme activating protein [uncultured Oscillibacter sp.]|uniref:glycyl-radical enzyme activating protein n=1 Tax=uncultured Oscillibacter sp. TaxID=876091 RepID=UPI002619FD4B|nr:glycyl-radical enzyme activating protein [uncultured Oscillibacter sp.]